MEIIIADDKLDAKELFELYNNWAEESVSPKTKKITYKELLSMLKKATTFIAKEGRKIVGFLMCRMKKSKEDTIMYNLKKGEEYANIDSMYVKPEFRHKGVGRKLIQACRLELKKQGKYKIIVLADSASPRELMSFYEKNGFKTLFISMESPKEL